MGPRILNNRILISKVGINNNSPRIFKRSFHSTKSLRIEGIDILIPTLLDSFALENLVHTITEGKKSLQAADFSNSNVTKAVDFLSSLTKKGTMTNAQFWDFRSGVLVTFGS